MIVPSDYRHSYWLFLIGKWSQRILLRRPYLVKAILELFLGCFVYDYFVYHQQVSPEKGIQRTASGGFYLCFAWPHVLKSCTVLNASLKTCCCATAYSSYVSGSEGKSLAEPLLEEWQNQRQQGFQRSRTTLLILPDNYVRCLAGNKPSGSHLETAIFPC